MAQKKTTAAKSGGAKKSTGSGGKKTTAGTKNTARTKKTAPQTGPARTVQRQAACVALLFVGLVALIAWFPVEGWLVAAFRTLLRGLFGWGFYLAPIALLWACFILGFHLERPAGARTACVLLLPVVFGAMVHMLAFQGEGLFAAGFTAGIQGLWQTAQEPAQRCGGVISGLIGLGLKKALGVVGSFLVLGAAMALMVITAMNKSVAALWEAFKNRPRPAPYEPELMDDIWEEEEEEPTPPPADDYNWVKEKASSRSRKSDSPVRDRKPARHRSLYDEDWEMQKDWLFAELEVDPAAAYRVEKALEARKAEESQAPAPAEEPKP
ncbi:MAG: hypothetical protein LUC89_03970, partial [Oscillospiraceae bacterium]|nr:hypothetical protein [Oscillospiraceae bacterium]